MLSYPKYRDPNKVFRKQKFITSATVVDRSRTRHGHGHYFHLKTRLAAQIYYTMAHKGGNS